MRAHKVTHYQEDSFHVKENMSFIGYLHKEIPFPKENWKVYN